MSLATVENIMQRISVATKKSPIAVFASDQEGRLDAIFASTVFGQKMTKQGAAGLVGVYSNADKAKKVEAELNAALV